MADRQNGAKVGLKKMRKLDATQLINAETIAVNLTTLKAESCLRGCETCDCYRMD